MSEYKDVPENNENSNVYSDSGITDGSSDKPVNEPVNNSDETYVEPQQPAEPKPESSQSAQGNSLPHEYHYSRQTGYPGDNQQTGAQNTQQQRPVTPPYTAPSYQTANQYQQNTYQQNQYQQQHYVAPPKPPKKSSAGKKILVALLAIVVIGASIGIGTSIGRHNGSNNTNTTTSAVSGENNSETETSNVAVEVATTKPSATQLSATDIAEKTRQCVVGVMAYSHGELNGEGSGVVMCEDPTGKYTYIITCAHVISSQGLDFSIMTLDGTSYTATLVGYDERTDIGVLKVEATGLPTATFGDSSALKIGETVYAIGNPGGSEYFGSMTSGIISAIDRSISSTYTMKVIQHDAAINPGNSGGALVNTSGQVVGINSSKIADTDYEGMGFAIPTSTAKSVAEALIAHGYVPNRPKLGIKYSEVSNYQFYTMLVKMKNLPLGSLIISAISTDSSLSGSNAQVGDLITAVNGVNLDTSDVLLDLIEESSVGDVLTLSICRVDTKSYETKTFEVQVKLIEDKGTNTYAEEETTTQAYQYGGNEAYDDFFRQFFGF